MKLIFKSKNVAKFEKEHGSILDLINTDINSLIGLIRLGTGNCDEDTAFDMLDAELIEKDTVDVMMDIIGWLQVYGFFPKKVPLQKMREQVEREMQNSIMNMTNSTEQQMMMEQIEDGATSGEL